MNAADIPEYEWKRPSANLTFSARRLHVSVPFTLGATDGEE
jgi:hypothetical protein